MLRGLLAGFSLLALAASAGAQINGALDAGDNYGSARAVQDTPTGFGDNESEINAVFANYTDSGPLRLLVTGNLTNNSYVFFFDNRTGGCVDNVLAGGYGEIGSIGGAKCDDWGTDTDGGFGVNPIIPSVLDPDFDPDFAIEVALFDGVYYTNVIDLTVPNEPSDTRDVYLGSHIPDGTPITFDYLTLGAPVGFGGQLTSAFNNTNTAGVLGYDFGNPPGPLGDPLSATTGYEMELDATFLNREGTSFKVMVFLTNGGGDFLSNQFCPGLDGAENLGFGGDPPGTESLFDARNYTGVRYIDLLATPCPCVWDLTGDCETGFEDLVELLAGYGTTYDFQDLVGLLGDYGCTG